MSHLQSMMALELESADIQGLTSLLMARGIKLQNVVFLDDLHLICTVPRRDFARLKDICRDRGDTYRIQRKTGLSWALRGLIRRPVLVLGLLFMLVLVSWISSRVLFIQVEGNLTIPDRQILEAAQSAGVYFGASRRELRSEQVKNTLLEAMPELRWACVNTSGCVAKITVRERMEQEKESQASAFGSIVASQDGIVLSCTATKGTLLCAPGQAVLAGQTLISGYTDCGIYIQAGQAEGEVYAQTRRRMEAVIPTELIQKMEIRSQEKKYTLILGKKRINFWQSSGISHALCDRMYAEYYVTLPGGFILPIALGVDTITYRQATCASLDRERAEVLLSAFSEDYLRSQMIAGQILSSETELSVYDSWVQLTGEYVCSEMIGRLRQERIGEYHGESN